MKRSFSYWLTRPRSESMRPAASGPRGVARLSATRECHRGAGRRRLRKRVRISGEGPRRRISERRRRRSANSTSFAGSPDRQRTLTPRLPQFRESARALTPRTRPGRALPGQSSPRRSPAPRAAFARRRSRCRRRATLRAPRRRWRSLRRPSASRAASAARS